MDGKGQRKCRTHLGTHIVLRVAEIGIGKKILTYLRGGALMR